MPEPNIDRYDWDFSSCPDDQLEACFEYELARHSRDKKQEVANWRRMFPRAKTFDNYWKLVLSDDVPMTIAEIFPEFPRTPFLRIPPVERCRRFAAIASFGIYPVGAEDGLLSKEFRDKHGADDRTWFEEGFHELCREFDLSNLSGVSHHGAKYRIEGNAIKCEDMGATFAVFRFHWRMCSNKDFLDCLRAWLHKNRTQPVRKGLDRRGRGAHSRHFRSQLKLLGAWRLLKCMTWQEAERLTQEESDTPLYSEQSAWLRARRRAEGFVPQT